VLGGAGQLITGMFAAGEVTGVAGINGSHGGSGTFLGPSVLTGRVAGRSAISLALGRSVLKAGPGESPRRNAPAATGTGTTGVGTPPDSLPSLLRAQRPGYWHFNVSHALVVERKDDCGSCHQGGWPPGPAVNAAQRVVQLDSCNRCH
jgi:hypothetical protein